MTVTMDQIHHIRNLSSSQGMNLSQIAKVTGHNWKTVQKYVDMEDFNLPSLINSTTSKPSKLDQFKPIIDEWLEGDKTRKRKQRHTAKRIYDRLTEEYPEFNCSYRLVATYVAKRKQELRLKEKDGYLPLFHSPEEAQLDFGEAEYILAGKKCTGKYVVIAFPASNAGFIQLFPGENMECLLEGMQNIFEFIGGVPAEIWFDNTATIVTKIMKDGERKLTETFLRFQAHYGFSAKFMNPASGWEKGNVENKVGYLRRNMLVPLPQISSLAEFNKKLLEMCAADHKRNHYVNREMISDLFEKNKKTFLPLPNVRFDTAKYINVRANKYGQFKLNKGKHTYSASPAFCGEQVQVKLTSTTVTVLDANQQEITTHVRLYGNTEQTSMDWIPYLRYIAKKPRSLRNTGIYKLLPGELQKYLDRCKPRECGRVLNLITDLTELSGFDNAIQTVEEAAKHNAHDDESLKNLHRRIFSEVPILSPIDIGHNNIDMSPIIPSNLDEYDRLLDGGINDD